MRQVGGLETSISLDLWKMGSKNPMVLNVNYREKAYLDIILKAKSNN